MHVTQDKNCFQEFHSREYPNPWSFLSLFHLLCYNYMLHLFCQLYIWFAVFTIEWQLRATDGQGQWPGFSYNKTADERNTKSFLAELRRPEGPPSGAPYPYREEKETHELIFSWLSWLVVLLVGAYARRRRRRRRRRRSRARWRPYSS